MVERDAIDPEVVASAPFGVATLTRDGTLIRCNAAFGELVQASPTALVGEAFIGLVAGRDRAAVLEAWADLDRGQRRVTVEHRLGAGDGDVVWCRTTLSRSAGSRATTCYVDDVTDQRAAVLMLRETERQYRAAFEGSPVGQAVCTLDGVVLHANRALARILGLEVARLLGGRLNDHALDESPISEDELLGLVRGTVASLEAERRFRHASGREIFAHVHLTLRRDRTGQPSELLVAVRDVTRRTIAERDRAAATAKLHQTLAELERSNADLEHFASVASHDLKAPLATVTGFLRTLADRESDRLSSTGAQMVDAALRGADRMESMMTALLEYAHRNRGQLDVSTVDLRDVIDGVLHALAPMIEEAGARVEVGPLPVLRADRPSLDIVLQNLIANAVKFRRPDVPPVVRVSVRHVGDARHVQVEDNGVGVAPEHREAIFEMFGRSAADAVGPAGHGIGLATVARAVERHGGRVWVEPGADGGSRFVVALPVLGAAASPATAPRPI